MLSTEQINQFKEQLLKQKEELTADNKVEVEEYSTELSNYDNHPADNASDLFEREKDMALDDHSEQELEKVEAALKAIEEGTYGVCAVSGKDIPFERLEAIPTALTVVEHANDHIPDDRPSEESVLSPSSDHPYRGEDEEIRDYQDSFSEAARYGTSETPSDMAGGEKDYDDLYEEDDNDEIVGTDIEGNDRKIYPDNE